MVYSKSAVLPCVRNESVVLAGMRGIWRLGAGSILLSDRGSPSAAWWREILCEHSRPCASHPYQFPVRDAMRARRPSIAELLRPTEAAPVGDEQREGWHRRRTRCRSAVMHLIGRLSNPPLPLARLLGR